MTIIESGLAWGRALGETRRMHLRLLGFLIGLLFPVVGWSVDWTQFRGSGGSGISDAKSAPLKWSDTDGLAWKTDLPGPGASSPVVFGNKIFLTCYTGVQPGRGGSLDDLQRHVLCLDRATGKLLWNSPVPADLPEQAGIREEHGYATSTPAVDAERVYVFFGKSGALAFDPLNPDDAYLCTHKGNLFRSRDAGETREALMEVLRQYPPSLGPMLATDPGLMSNTQFMTAYPSLAQFLQQHPEVARNPMYYFQSYRSGSSNYFSNSEEGRAQQAINAWRNIIEGFTFLLGFLSVVAGITWIIRSIIDHRRWSRLSKVQAAR